MEHADVVVVGAGLAGLQCARLLARRGRRVVVVDRKQSPGQFIHTTGIFVRRTFEDFAFPAGTLGPGIRRVTVHSPSGRTVALESARDEFRIGHMRPLYDAYLADAIAAGAEFRGGASFRSIDGEVAAFTTGRIATRVIVGADGASSRVAGALGLRAPSEFLVGVEEVFASRRDAVPQLHCFLDPLHAPGYIGWIADDGDAIHAGAAGLPRRFDAVAALCWIRAHLAPGAGAPVERRGGRIPVAGVSRTIATPRGLLVGDAAGAVSPLTAGGLDAALRLSAFAAQAIDHSLQSGEPLPRTYSGAPFRTRFLSRLWMRRAYALLRPSHLDAAVALLAGTPLHAIGEKLFFGHGSFPIEREALGSEAVLGGVF